MNEHDEVVIQEGRDAAIVEGTVKPYLLGQIDNKVSHLVNSYRAKSLDGVEAVTMVAEISALRGLLEELELRQRRGYVAAEREYHGTQEEYSSFNAEG